MKPTVLVLAGARQGGCDTVAEAEAVSHKSLARVEGETLLARVVRAAREFGASEVAVSASDPAVIAETLRLGAMLLPNGHTPSESVTAALARFGAPLIVTTSDHALLEASWLEALSGEAPPSVDVAVMMARRDVVEAVAPGSARTWLKLADGQWSGCNLFLLASPAAARAASAWQQVESERKHPWRLAWRLGPQTWIDYSLGKLTMGEGIERMGRRMGVSAALVPAPDGRAAIDVDKPSDLELVRLLAACRQVAPSEKTAPAEPA